MYSGVSEKSIERVTQLNLTLSFGRRSILSRDKTLKLLQTPFFQLKSLEINGGATVWSWVDVSSHFPLVGIHSQAKTI